MRFYCPSCQKEYEAEPSETKTTLSGRVAYKAPCPACGQDMAEFIPGEKIEPGNDTSVPSASVAGPAEPAQAPVATSGTEEKTIIHQPLPEPGMSPLGGPAGEVVAGESTEAQSLLNQAVESLTPQVLDQVSKEVIPESSDSV